MEKEVKNEVKSEEPRAGEGVRSLQTWQRLAEARRALNSENGAREEMASDPAAYFQRFGVDGVAVSERSNLSDLERQLGVAANSAPQLELRSEARRGCAAVVVVWAGAVAVNAVGAANVAAVVNAAAAANAAANANWTANWNWAAGCD